MISTLVAASLMQSADLASHLRPIQVESKSDSDLEPLLKAIGKARVVQLGELTHGDGTSFRIKSRVMKFLHQRAGFDVLIWESGFVECSQLDERLKGNEPIAYAASSAVFPHWSQSRESIGIFEFARETHKTSKPLQMAGFDIQFSSSTSGDQYLNLIDQVCRLTNSTSLKNRLNQLQKLPPGDSRDQAILEAAEATRGAFTKHPSTKNQRELRQKVNSFSAYDEMMKSFRRFQKTQTGEEFQIGYNLRERANFENLMWLIYTKFKGRKVVVWAHNSHVSNWGADGQYHEPAKGEVVLDSTGRHLKAKLGKELYTVGFVAKGGKWSWLGQPAVSFATPPIGSIEDDLALSNHDHGFIDLVSLPKSLKSQLTARPGFINRQSPETTNANWTKAFDGLFFIREMAPRTDLRKTPQVQK